MAKQQGQKIQELSFEEVMGERFGRYSKYIIQERALPDIRDGLKPVQRRILYAMAKDGNTYDKGFRKSAKSVGNVMGNFHPHGDSSIYEAMVRMSQSWKNRAPLIQMHGNNGSMDGDPPAAMRYTEARLSKISGELLADIDKETVDMVLNFDDTEYEPTVLPAGFPNLLVNGATGISAGYATEIPPHNLNEVIDGIMYLMDHPDASLDKIMTFVKGPDFPTGAIVQGADGIRKAFETGRGKIIVRSKTSIQDVKGNRQQIVITELPYEVNKANLVKKIDEIRVLKKVDGISEVRDETDRHGLSIVIDLKRNADAQGILNYLLKNTELQIAYNYNMVAISHMQPVQAGLIEILQAYIEHREDVVTRRTKYNLKKASDRLHIINGLMKALSILNDVIKTIRASQNKKSAKENLMKAYDFSEKQAEAIVSLQLYRLTNTDITALQKESDELNKQIMSYQKILNDPKELKRVIKSELRHVEKEYGSPRKTQIEAEVSDLKVDTSVMVADDDVMVMVSHDGYLKRSSMRSFQASAEDGLKDVDYPVLQVKTHTLAHLYIFTNYGHMIYRPVHEILDAHWKDAGEHLSQTVGLASDESVIAAYIFEDLDQTGQFVMASTDGYIKQTSFADLKPGRTYKSHPQQAIKLHDDHVRLADIYYVAGDEADLQVVSASHKGYGLRFALSEVSTMGARTRGVKLMDLKPEDTIVDFVLVSPDAHEVGIITQRGAFKKMNVTEIPVMSRARRGVQILRELKRNPHRIAAMTLVTPATTLMVETDQQQFFAIDPTQYPSGDRYSNGSFVLDPDEIGAPSGVHLKRLPDPEDEN
ncbi:parC protein [Lactobacillus selangorensis]|uniref:DNA topoisomerase 4 subunit A n=1 Tax=Lactobacillus selangorensis TaxID=81857 RepID=A0A0R2G705_9LACO|nr:DNA topoisomerase IV subunit A [Lactobacillus selangorensis]KRN29466.1 parC protein [Lactobacillus selangorensis]KRN34005.1 parC protein [Lactobacillus selangorensis]